MDGAFDMDPLDKISYTLGRIEAKLDAAIGEADVQRGRVDGVAAQVNKIENKLYWYAGVAAAIAVVFGFLKDIFLLGKP